MIIYIFGEDTFRSRQYLKKTIEQFKKQRDPQGFNVISLDAKKETAGKVYGELAAAPFMAERRMIVLENVLSSSDKELLGGLIDKIKNQQILGSNVAVFWQGEPLSKVKEAKELAEILKKEKLAQEFKALTASEMSNWAKKEIESRGVTVGTHALNYLSQNVNGDMWLLSSLVDQLTAYKSSPANGEITLADIQLFLEEKADDNIFSLVDSAISGNIKTAYKLKEDQYRIGEDDAFIFSMLMRQFKILLEIRDLFDRGDNMTSDEMAGALGLHPFVVKKSLPLVKRYSMNKLKGAYDELMQIDLKTKTGQGDQGLLLDLFIGRLGIR